MDFCEAETSPNQTDLLLISQDNVILVSFSEHRCAPSTKRAEVNSVTHKL